LFFWILFTSEVFIAICVSNSGAAFNSSSGHLRDYVSVNLYFLCNIVFQIIAYFLFRKREVNRWSSTYLLAVGLGVFTAICPTLLLAITDFLLGIFFYRIIVPRSRIIAWTLLVSSIMLGILLFMQGWSNATFPEGITSM